MTETSPDVLIIGAGPTGLVLALYLVKMGISVRIVDKTREPGTTSRALAVQARTLELYRAIDLADTVVERGLVLGAVNLWRDGERVAHVDLGAIGTGQSPYPFGVIFPQDEHERLLVERLQRLGVHVERSTELLDFDIGAGDRVVATLRHEDGSVESCAPAYLAGCDGARSTVREGIKAGFPGGTYEHLFYVADLEARGAVMDKQLHVVLDPTGFLGLFPLAGQGRARLVGTIRDDARAPDRALGWNDVDRTVIERIGLDVRRVHWFSTYRVHHRVASAFRRGPVFLLGDAAHVHSPVGGQGMNTGIGDAINLAWKLAAALRRRAHADVLDTYEPERIAFARRLVSTTDRVFQAASSPTKLARAVRTRLAPRILARVSETQAGQHFIFRTVSQIGISYRKSTWSEGHAGSIHAGDRLPWVVPSTGAGPDNFTPLRSLDWQAHVYGVAPADLEARCSMRALALHIFPFDGPARAAGLRDDQLYLVRPDGHVGMITPLAKAAEELQIYLDKHGLGPRSGGSA